MTDRISGTTDPDVSPCDGRYEILRKEEDGQGAALFFKLELLARAQKKFPREDNTFTLEIVFRPCDRMLRLTHTQIELVLSYIREALKEIECIDEAIT